MSIGKETKHSTWYVNRSAKMALIENLFPSGIQQGFGQGFCFSFLKGECVFTEDHTDPMNPEVVPNCKAFPMGVFSTGPLQGIFS